MAASSTAASFHHRAGRSYAPPYYQPTSAGTAPKPLASASVASPSRSGDEYRASAVSSSPKSNRRNNGPRTKLRDIDANMILNTATTKIPATTRPASGHAKLHKRGGSGSSLPGPPALLHGPHPTFTTPFATYEEPFADISSTPPTSSTPKIKPYLRKMSSAKDDEGKIDLSRSTAENELLVGLGIQDFGTKSASDVSFAHAGRRTTSHTRTTSVGSHMSNGAGAKPFVHPMRQAPRPYTPPTGQSYASSLNEDEAHESSDIVDDDFRLGPGFRTRRSMSISSTPQIPPTPLSQSITPSDLGLVPKLTSLSQTNLSVKSGRSVKSSRSKLGRSRRDTGRSIDNPTSPSSRTSFDKAFSLMSRRSDTDPQTRDERIREARRKFNEKEADKERKLSKEAIKRRETDEAKGAERQERQRRKSEGSERSRNPRPSASRVGRKSGRRGREVEKLDARPYETYRRSNEASLPVQGSGAGCWEKTPQARQYQGKRPPSGWLRFTTWVQTRLLSCGGHR